MNEINENSIEEDIAELHESMQKERLSVSLKFLFVSTIVTIIGFLLYIRSTRALDANGWIFNIELIATFGFLGIGSIGVFISSFWSCLNAFPSIFKHFAVKLGFLILECFLAFQIILFIGSSNVAEADIDPVRLQGRWKFDLNKSYEFVTSHTRISGKQLNEVKEVFMMFDTTMAYTFKGNQVKLGSDNMEWEDFKAIAQKENWIKIKFSGDESYGRVLRIFFINDNICFKANGFDLYLKRENRVVGSDQSD